ncbi:putative homeodomain containing protein [Lyophyllum shimeji]|uniref:Homeodomain containing protein n=1 Tax=Lyophyllum shimeji TaxID=47721 RepID=A0A9P3URF1_LYOSH|nr:putative homeodomain containing protein [Lyophyllum shimeji]
MSKSRSPTPTPANTVSTANITPSPQSTTSRTHSHEHIPSVPTSGDSDHRFILRPVHPHSLLAEAPETSHRSPASALRRAEANPADLPMAKRFRKESPKTQSGPTSKSSPSSDSQGDMADTEIDDRKTQQSDPPPPAVPLPKKKRTRTLTTPHQSAVLHALLAQSRFPTTAMREEVGRSIGLSARKVQIWFQNQRQKARRPRSQGDTSRKRFPQYGPFPSGPETSAVGSFSLAHEQGPSTRMAHGLYSAPPGSAGYATSSGYHSSESVSASMDSPTQLLGPGMPGSELLPDMPYRTSMFEAALCALPEPSSLVSPARVQAHDQHQQIA